MDRLEKVLKNEDLRVIKTRNALREAMLRILEKKKFKKISIKELTETAMVSRQTFYLHYETKEALLADSVKQMYAGINEQILVKMAAIENYDSETIINVAQEVSLAEFSKLKIIFSVDDSKEIIDSIYKSLNNYLSTSGIISNFKTVSRNTNFQHQVKFVAAGMYMMYSEWVKEPCKEIFILIMINSLTILAPYIDNLPHYYDSFFMEKVNKINSIETYSLAKM